MLCETALGKEGLEGVESFADAGPRHRIYVVLKGVVEWIAALILLILLSPIIGILALLVRCTSAGPAFYSQVRLGLNGVPYRIYKLRTMAHECEKATGAVWSPGASDPRVTPLGRVLRDTHLDELPQLWNVIKRDMCLIGPRPERPEIAANLERAFSRYRERLLVKPGVTGLAQVQLPPDVDLESVRRKLAYDLHYVREVNPILDARILFATFLKFAASAFDAVGRGLVKSEKQIVEAQNYGGVKIAVSDSWHVGAA